MCGVIGFISEKAASKEQIALFRNLLIEDTRRGSDSTGLAAVGDGSAWIAKRAVDGQEFVVRGEANFLFDKEIYAAIGHNRAASRGGVNDRNAHPFGLQVGGGWDFACHNGTFSHGIAEFLNTEDYPVDSEVVLTKIAKDYEQSGNIIEAIKGNCRKITSENKGSYAVLYLATGNKEVYAFRDDNRPLAAIKTRDHGLWLCSTKDIFKDAWTRLEGVALPFWKDAIVEVRELEPYKIYKASNGDITEVGEIFTKKELRELAEKWEQEKSALEKEYRESRRPSFYDNERLRNWQGAPQHQSAGTLFRPYSEVFEISKNDGITGLNPDNRPPEDGFEAANEAALKEIATCDDKEERLKNFKEERLKEERLKDFIELRQFKNRYFRH